MVDFDEFGPEKILEVHDSTTGMHGFLVIDNTALGPGKGGIRMTPSVTIDEVAKLARTMTWKCALAELLFGGAKSGVVANVKKLKKEEKMEIIRAFSRALKPVCPSVYIAAPDMNTAEEEMAVFAMENGSMKAATGKPSNLCVAPGEKCGIPHEYGSTGFGIFRSTLVATKHIGLDIEGATVAIEGFGNVGNFTARYLTKRKVRLIAVSDSKGCIYSGNGLDYQKLSKVKRETGSVINYRPGKVIENEKIFELPVDILIPAAMPNVINEKNVNKIRARIVVEAANIPVTPKTEERLHEKGILVVPDIVANVGGVISSYSEYIGENPKQIFKFVVKKIEKNIKVVLERAEEKGIKPRDAGVEIAKKRVNKAMERKS